MPNDTVRASTTALPIPTRRLFLAAGSAAAVFATVKRAAAGAPAASSHPDAELLALGPAIKEADRQQSLAIDAETKVDDAFFEKKRALQELVPIAPDDPEWTAALQSLRKANQAAEGRLSTGAHAEAMAAWKAQIDALDAEHTKAVEGITAEANEKIAALRDEVANWQPETLEGLIFKARYAFEHYPEEYDDVVAFSIVDDLLAIAETGLISRDGRA